MVARAISRKKPRAIRACQLNSKKCAGIAGVVAYSGAIPAGIVTIRNREQIHHLWAGASASAFRLKRRKHGHNAVIAEGNRTLGGAV